MANEAHVAPETPPSQAGFLFGHPLLVLAACALACLPFIPGLWGPFQHDDFSNIPRLNVGPFSLEALLDVMVRNESGLLRRPLSNLALALNYWAHGIGVPFGFKLGNLLVHLSTGIAGYWLLLELLKLHSLRERLPWRPEHIALLAAVIWIIHPLQVSTALYVGQRRAQLATLFTFLTVAYCARQIRLGEVSLGNPARNFRICIGFVVGTLLAVASKENGALTAPLLATVLWLTIRADAPATRVIERYRPTLYLCILIPAVAVLALAGTRPEMILGGYVGRPWTLDERLLTQAVVMWKYVWLIVFPAPSGMGLYHEVSTYGPHSATAWVASVGWLTTLVGALLAKRIFPLSSWAVLWFVGSHLMESTILPLEMMYEHRNYTGLLGFAVIAALGVAHTSARLGTDARLLWVVPVLLLAGLTLMRALDWSTPERFYAAEYRNHPHSYRSLLGIYAALKGTGAYPEMLQDLEDELVSRRSEEPWTTLVAVERSCRDRSIRPDWASIRSKIREAPRLGRMSEYASMILTQMRQRTCEHLDAKQFKRVLELSYRKALYANHSRHAEAFGTLAARMSRLEGDMEAARNWYWRAARANPNAYEPLFELSYMDLNLSDSESVQKALDELQRRQDTIVNPIRYRIQELEKHLATLKSELQGSQPHFENRSEIQTSLDERPNQGIGTTRIATNPTSALLAAYETTVE